MFKFLRRYNKWILAVFGTLLLLVFLVPTTLTEITRRSAALGGTWALVDGDTKVTEAERQRMAGQLVTLEQLERETGMIELRRIRADTGLDLRQPEHWYLLVRDAEQAGLIGGPEEGRLWLQDQASRSGGAITEAEIVGRLARASNQTPTQVLETLSSLRGVLRMLQIARAFPLSDARAKLAASQSQMSASCDVVVIDSKNPLPGGDPAEPSAEALAAQFQEFREVAPATGERGFGYLIPDRLKLEWFKIPVESVRTSLAEDPRVGALELRKAYLKDPGSFFPPTVAGSYPEFDDVEAEVKAKVIDRLARERQLEIVRFVEDQLALSLRGAAKRGGYVELTPEIEAKQPSFDQIARAVSEQFSVPVPEYTGIGDAWMQPAESGAISGLGSASTTRFGTTPRRLPELLRSLREFGGSPTILVQRGVAGPPLFAPGPLETPTDLFFFRVVAAEASHAPATIDEVADVVRQDLLRVARYEALTSRATQIEAKAIEPDGLAAVATEYGVSVGFMPRVSEFGRTEIPGLGPATPDTTTSIIERAMRLPKTTPVADVPDAERTFTVLSPGKLALLVIRITNIIPVSAEDFEVIASSGRLSEALRGKISSPSLPAIYGYDALAARHDFKPSRVATPDEPAE